jgi:DNA polymerase
LEELLQSVGLKRTDVYITNVVKCRPPGNRDPQDEELSACRDYIDRQIRILKPRIIVTLGRYSMARYMQEAKISLVHGNAMWIKGQMIIPMYHPAAGLHQPSLKTTIQKDFEKLPEFIIKARSMPVNQMDETSQPSSESNKPEATQMNLF